LLSPSGEFESPESAFAFVIAVLGWGHIEHASYRSHRGTLGALGAFSLGFVVQKHKPSPRPQNVCGAFFIWICAGVIGEVIVLTTPTSGLVGKPPLCASAAASQASSVRSAAAKRAWSMRSRTWLLKSQYGHLARQNGQWI